MALNSVAGQEGRDATVRVSLSGLTTAAKNVVRPVIAVVGLYLLWHSYVGMNIVGTLMMLFVMMVVFTTVPFVKCDRAVVMRSWRWWFGFAATIIGFSILRSYADQAGMPVQYTYPIRIEDWLFGGKPLAVHLQRLMSSTPRHDPFTIIMVSTYLSFFAVPTLVGIYLGRRKPEALPRYVVATFTLLGLGLIFFYLVPTAPPWMASRDGFTPLIYRVDSLVIDPGNYAQGLHIIGVNDVAAMPSLHVAQTWLAMLAATSGRLRARLVGIVYGLAMVLAVLYLGEHWFVDVVVGLAMTGVIWRLSPALVNMVRWPSRQPSTTVETVPQRS